MSKLNYKDLMVGDWIMYKSDSPENAFPIQITAEMFCNELIKWADRYEYIPLTKEILEKNGFESKCNIGYIYEDGFGGKVIYDTFDDTLKIFNNYDMLFNITFFDRIAVHELQHVLKVCKIYKEIEL